MLFRRSEFPAGALLFILTRHSHRRAERVVYDWMGEKDRCAQWHRPGGHDQGGEDWKAPADFADDVFPGKWLPRPEELYQEPWPKEPLHFSWTAPR